MTKREAARIVRAAVRRTKLSPEAFVARYPNATYGASARTLRRWMAGQTVPHVATVERLRSLTLTPE